MDMKILAIISRKGGAGKTTLSTHLAVMADNLGYNTAIFDLDPQASAASWADEREQDTPTVLAAQASRLPRLIEQARDQGADLVILDTPPSADTIGAEAAKIADAVLIPCRPSGLDLKAIEASCGIATFANKPFFVVCNAAPVIGTEVEEMKAALDAAGVMMAPVVIHQRKDFYKGMHEGRTALEIDARGKARQEAFHLFLWVAEQMGFAPSPDQLSTPKAA